MRYFAYGSNMYVRRLRSRVPSASFVTLAYLPGHELRFHKRSKNGSGKCNAYATGNQNDRVQGAIFEIDPTEKVSLDRAEGLCHGYCEKPVLLESDLGQIEAFTYVAEPSYIDEYLKPYTWYLHFVITGAEECGINKSYLINLQNTPAMTDPNEERETLERHLINS